MASTQNRYWRLVFRRACKEARAALSIETGERAVVGIVLSITAIALLWFFGSEGATWDASLERVGPWMVIILALYPIVFAWKFLRTPPRLDKERLDRIEELERQLTPQLEFVWPLDPVREVEAPVSPVEIDGKVGSISVRNRSELARADSVEVALLSYRKADWDHHSELNARVFSGSMQEMIVNINPGREEYFELFKLKHRAEWIRLGPFASPRRVNIFPGKYEIRVVASASVGRPVEEKCFLHFTDYDSIEFRRWQPDDDAS